MRNGELLDVTFMSAAPAHMIGPEQMLGRGALQSPGHVLALLGVGRQTACMSIALASRCRSSPLAASSSSHMAWYFGSTTPPTRSAAARTSGSSRTHRTPGSRVPAGGAAELVLHKYEPCAVYSAGRTSCARPASSSCPFQRQDSTRHSGVQGHSRTSPNTLRIPCSGRLSCRVP